MTSAGFVLAAMLSKPQHVESMELQPACRYAEKEKKFGSGIGNRSGRVARIVACGWYRLSGCQNRKDPLCAAVQVSSDVLLMQLEGSQPPVCLAMFVCTGCIVLTY